MTITEMIEQGDYGYLLEPRSFQNIKPHRADEFVKEINFIVENSPKTYILPDSDVDGIMSSKMLFELITTVSDVVPDVHIFSGRLHGLTSAISYDLIKNNYEYVIVMDSSTNNMLELLLLAKHGIRVMVMDHHVSSNKISDYPDGVILFNNRVDMSAGVKIPYTDASCGLLAVLYCNYFMSTIGCTIPGYFWLYASITLYSDVMNTLNKFNVMIINYVRNSIRLDRLLGLISGRSDTLPSRYIITFSINPKINACIRCGRMDLIHKLFFTHMSYADEEEVCREVNEINAMVKTRLRDVENNLLFKDNMFVSTVDLTEHLNTVIIDFKGYIANKISEQTGNICIAYYVAGDLVHGSVRDSLGRNMLSVFSEFCKAEGHPQAFGIEIDKKYFDELIRYVSYSVGDVSVDEVKPMILDSNEHEITTLDIKNMSIFNEYATTNNICIKVKIDPYVYRITSYQNMYTIKSTKTVIKSGTPVNYGDTIIAVPTYGSQIELRLKSRYG